MKKQCRRKKRVRVNKETHKGDIKGEKIGGLGGCAKKPRKSKNNKGERAEKRASGYRGGGGKRHVYGPDSIRNLENAN